MQRLAKNAKAPDFSAQNQDGEIVSLESFGEKFIVLYFYPKDSTKGCTIEANDFTALLGEFMAFDALVVGVSPDSIESHQKFIAKEGILHILLSDCDKKIAKSYGAFGTKNLYGKVSEGVIRSTFIIKNGVILESFYNVRAANHAKKVLESLQKLYQDYGD